MLSQGTSCILILPGPARELHSHGPPETDCAYGVSLLSLRLALRTGVLGVLGSTGIYQRIVNYVPAGP